MNQDHIIAYKVSGFEGIIALMESRAYYRNLEQ